MSTAWWLERLFLPACFILLGALIAFASGWLLERLAERKAKQAFLKAIKAELNALNDQLQASFSEIMESRQRFLRDPRFAPELAGGFRTIVFTSQIGKMSNLADPVVIEIVKFYSDLSTLEELKLSLNRRATEGYRISDGEMQKRHAATIGSILQVMEEEFPKYLSRAKSLLTKLPG